jgi:cellobiose-specific phosphotransferase system component IIB
MKTILILGAGLSSNMLVRYFVERAEALKVNIRLGDKSIATAFAKVENCAP